MLVYLPDGQRGIESPILWMDSSGQTMPLREMPSDWSNSELCAGWNRLAIDVVTGAARPDVGATRLGARYSREAHARFRRR